MKLLGSTSVVLVLGLLSACGEDDRKSTVKQETPPVAAPVAKPTFGLSDDEAMGLREFTTEEGRAGALVLFDEQGKVLAAGEEFPYEMATAKVCVQHDKPLDLLLVQAFKSCCDKTGIADLSWQASGSENCWTVQGVACKAPKFRMRFTFRDGDSGLYRNPVKAAKK